MRMLLPSVLLLAGTGALHARSLGSIEFAPCTLAPEGAMTSVEAQCGTLRVPEDRATPGGRQIELAIAWIVPEGDAEPDPVFMLAGGPGQAARDAYPSTAAAFRDVARRRNIVLVDQRGTGGSNPLRCPDGEGRSAFTDPDDATLEGAERFARRCLEQLRAHADPRFYTTGEAIRDLDAVREAIGAERINLVGISYGTRVAQQYVRAFPQHVRSVVLDGVVPNSLVLGEEHARNLEAALEQHFAQCRAAPACAERVGDPRQALLALREELTAASRPVEYRDAVSGELLEKELTWGHVAGVARLFAYAPQTAALLPLTLSEAARGRPAPLMAQSEMILAQVGEQIMHGMQLSVSCSEDASGLRARDEDAGTVLGVEFVEFTLAQCRVWPKGDVAADFREPLSTDAAVLLLSGERDPVTPPRYGEAVLHGRRHPDASSAEGSPLPNARHLVLAGQGHNVIGVGCMPKLMAQFIDSTDPRSLETECLDHLVATPSFSGFHGWEP